MGDTRMRGINPAQLTWVNSNVVPEIAVDEATERRILPETAGSNPGSRNWPLHYRVFLLEADQSLERVKVVHMISKIYICSVWRITMNNFNLKESNK